MPAIDPPSPSSMDNKYARLARRKELKRLRQLREMLPPEQYITKHGALHKAISAVLRHPENREEAIVTFIDCFVPLLRQRPLPDWIDLLDEVQDSAEQLGNSLYIAQLIVRRCRYLHDLDLLDELANYANNKLESDAIVAHRLIQVDLLIFLASVYVLRSDYAQGTLYIQQGTTLLATVASYESHDRFGRLLNLRGVIENSKWNWSRAIVIFDQAKRHLKQSGNQFYYHVTCVNLSQALTQTNQKEECLWTLNEAITFFKQNKHKYRECFTLVELAAAYSEFGDVEQEEKTLLSVDINYLYQIPPTSVLARFHSNLGYHYLLEALYELSENHLLAAIKTYKELGDSYNLSLANTLALLGSLHGRQGNLTEQDGYFLQSLDLLPEYLEMEDEKALHLLARFKEDAPHLFE